MGVNDRCAVGQCNNARKYPEKFVIKPHILAFDTSLQLRFWKCTDPKLYPKWTFACNRKNFKFGKYNVVCSNHFEYGRPTDVSPVPTLYLKGYDDESSLAVKRKSPAKRSVPLKKSKILNSSPSKDVNDSTMKNEQMSKRIIDFEINSVDIDVDSTICICRFMYRSFLLPKIQILLQNLRLVLWYYLIKASTFKICFCHVK